ncbi:MAG: hypothetical protein IPJ81_14785 [Chitinophagaceae bacterium]|nr:hypothetical protein [Chitinophagaceae bacterium]
MKKLIFLLQKHCAVLTLLLLLAFVQQSCTKTNEAAEAATTSVENFLTLPPGTNPELKPVVDNLQQQFQKNNFAANFLAWHGQPLWNHTIKIKNNTGDTILLIPTKKANEVTAFIEVMYNKENFFYGLHRKSSIANTIKEYSNIGFDEAAVKWFMDYFDAKLGGNTTANKSNLVSPPYCWYESCTNGGGYSKTGTASANPVSNQPCWIKHCADEGGGGGDGGNGGGGFPPSPTPTPTPCPVNDGWYNIIPPPPCDIICLNGTFAGGQCITFENYPGMENGYPYLWWQNENWINLNFSINIDDYGEYKKLSYAERQWIKSHPEQALMFKKNAQIAATETKLRFKDLPTVLNPNPWLNTKADAFRHAYWCALNTLSCGSTLAMEYGVAHESEVPALLYQEKDMDLFNNSVGINIAKGYWDPNTIDDVIYEQVLSGKMKYLKFLDYIQSPKYDPKNKPNCNTCRNGFVPGLTQFVFTNQ